MNAHHEGADAFFTTPLALTPEQFREMISKAISNYDWEVKAACIHTQAIPDRLKDHKDFKGMKQDVGLRIGFANGAQVLELFVTGLKYVTAISRVVVGDNEKAQYLIESMLMCLANNDRDGYQVLSEIFGNTMNEMVEKAKEQIRKDHGSKM